MSRPDPTVVEELVAGRRRAADATKAEREAAVAKLTKRGHSEAEIAWLLRVAPRTVGRIRGRLRAQQAVPRG